MFHRLSSLQEPEPRPQTCPYRCDRAISAAPPLDIAARADAEEGIRQGLEDAKKGKIRPAREFFDEFEAKHGIPR